MKTPPIPAAKLKQAGRLCKIGAWTILGFGILYTILTLAYTWPIYLEEQNRDPGRMYIYESINTFIMPALASICQVAIVTILGFVLLTVISNLLAVLTTSTEPGREETEDIVYETLPEQVRLRK
jgi:hypothetical protein